jgi:osmotically inducible protein OsmC
MTTKTLLTAHASAKGGRNGHSQTSDGRMSFELAMPGSQKTGVTTNPEELFACGYAACFGGALDYVASQQKISAADAEVKIDVSLNQNESGFFLGVTLNVSVPGLDQATATKLIEAAHQVCPYSKATRGNVDVKLLVNDQPLAQAA